MRFTGFYSAKSRNTRNCEMCIRDRIREAIFSQLDRGVTILHGEGGYGRNSEQVLLSVISNRQLPKLDVYKRQPRKPSMLWMVFRALPLPPTLLSRRWSTHCCRPRADKNRINACLLYTSCPRVPSCLQAPSTTCSQKRRKGKP